MRLRDRRCPASCRLPAHVLEQRKRVEPCRALWARELPRRGRSPAALEERRQDGDLIVGVPAEPAGETDRGRSWRGAAPAPARASSPHPALYALIVSKIYLFPSCQRSLPSCLRPWCFLCLTGVLTLSPQAEHHIFCVPCLEFHCFSEPQFLHPQSLE